MERKHRALLLALPTVLTLLFFFVAPMVYILVHTLHENGFSDFVDFFGDPFYRNILWVTLRVSLVSTAISLVLGYPTAFYMARTKSRMKFFDCRFSLIFRAFPAFCLSVIRCADHKKRPFFIQRQADETHHLLPQTTPLVYCTSLLHKCP